MLARRFAATPADHIADTLRLFFEPDDVFEVRALDHGGKGKKSAGWFKGSTIDQAAAVVAKVAGAAGGVYFTPNPSSAECFQRCGGMIRPAFFKLTADADVPQRRWLIIDVDPVRPDEFKKDSATDPEKAEALFLAVRVAGFLKRQGWPEPLTVDSGNGLHLYYRLPEPLAGGQVITASDPLATLLVCLKARFDTAHAHIDGTVYNASRLMKVPGTPARKGPGTADRPHRQSRQLKLAAAGDCRVSRRDAATIAELIAELDPGGAIRGRRRVQAEPTARPSSPRPDAPGVDGLPPLARRIERATKYLKKIPDAIDGGGGSKPTFLAARVLVHGFCLDERTAFELLWTEYNPRASRPWTEAQLRHKLQDAANKPFSKPRGWVFANDRRPSPRAVIGKTTGSSDAAPEVGHPAAGPTVATEKARRCEILQSPAELHHVVAASIEALVAKNDPPVLFAHGDALVRLQAGDDDRPVKPLSKSQLRLTLSEAARYVAETTTKDGEIKQKDVWPKSELVECVQDHPGGWKGIPSLKSVVNMPVITAESGLLTRPGYDAASGVYLLPGGHNIVDPVPERPDRDDVEQAKELLLGELLGDFPFVDEASRANTLAMYLLPFVRTLIDGPTPLHHIDAPQEGTGKSLLAETWGNVALGRLPSPFGEVTKADDWQKMILAAQIESPPLIYLDNLNGHLDSSYLALALTSSSVSGRLLGFTRIVSAPVRNVWISTGNNVTMSRELVRRTLYIRIQANRKFAYLGKKYRHALPGWALDNRGKLVWACLVVCQAWVANGMKPGRLLLGKYESWSATMDGILRNVGIDALLGNMDKLRGGVTDEQDDWDGFVAVWWEQYADRWVTVRDLFPLAQNNDMLGNIRGDGNEDSQRKRLGRAVKKQRDAVFGDGFQIIAPDLDDKQKSSKRVVEYRLSKLVQDVAA